jgi:prepilin-type N-terminal cleavage/methylation domain-containing protein
MKKDRVDICSPARSKDSGFTLIELLVVIAIIAILAAMLLPALATAKQKALGVQCMSNDKQLTLANLMYTYENNDRLLFASNTGTSDPNVDPYVWVLGQMDNSPANRSNWDVGQDIAKSPLWPYCGKQAAIWRCPADRSYVTISGKQILRVRSKSMNFWIGGFGGGDGGLSGGNWKLFFKLSQMTDPGPSKTWMFIDMREDSIDVGNFATDMTGYPDNPSAVGFYDLPAFYHHRACGVSFSDGHSEIHRWRDDRTMPPLVANGQVNDGFRSPRNQDVLWLQDRATRHK